jgi:hypothetical protein
MILLNFDKQKSLRALLSVRIQSPRVFYLDLDAHVVRGVSFSIFNPEQQRDHEMSCAT